MLKRLFDIIFSLIGLVIISPILLILSLMIKFEGGGPIFYRGQRTGKNNRPFKIFKFRSMVVDAEKLGGPTTSADDARLTKIGAFLRKYKLDELPQLINVLKGEMSFVGPRPEVEEVVKLYTDEEKKLLSVFPGITDWASLWDSHEEEVVQGALDPHQAYLEKIWPEKKRLGLKYVNHHNLLIDIKIILKTIKKIFL